MRTTASRRCALVQWALCSVALTAAALLTRAVLHPAGVDLPLDATLTLALVLGLVGSPAARLRIEALASGRSAVPVLFAWCAGLAALLTWLGIGVLVPAAATGAAMHAVVVAPQRRRAVQSFVITAVVTAGSLTAEGLGLAAGLLPVPASTALSLAFLAITWPSVMNAFEASERASRERLEHVAELEHASQHDALTGLLSRRGLEARLEAACAQAAPDRACAVLFVDLDGFTAVNDAHGHAAGDALLVEVASRLRSCVRDGDAVARVGGDEFVLVLTRVAGEAEVGAVAGRVGARVAAEVVLGSGARVRVGASTGTAVATSPCSADELLTAADARTYAQKRTRRTDRPAPAAPVP